MLLDERRKNLLQIIENKGFVSLAELSEQVGVSESTVRRDLEYLDGIGQVRRTRGGAAYVGDSLTEFEDRRTRALPQKQRIAQVAAGLIESGEAVLLDGGTTTLEVARQLVGKSLQVVTNSLPIVNLLSNQPNIELVMIGGYLYPKTGVALGPLAAATLENIHVRRLFVSVGGITEKGLFNSNALLVETERKMIDAADELIVVSDSGKLGHSALAHLCPLEVVDRIVTDSEITPAWRKTIENAGVELTVVDI
ncbi:MAG: DeoR/GlpR family DNA-binding transcription regulator [Planctomycetaceae bacterium]